MLWNISGRQSRVRCISHSLTDEAVLSRIRTEDFDEICSCIRVLEPGQSNLQIDFRADWKWSVPLLMWHWLVVSYPLM